MPTYEYKCKNCGNTFEKFQSITEPPVKICKNCKGEVYRLISKNGNFILKGSGFYSTDYRTNKLPSEKKDSPGLKPEKSNKKDTSPVSKPESKKEK